MYFPSVLTGSLNHMWKWYWIFMLNMLVWTGLFSYGLITVLKIHWWIANIEYCQNTATSIFLFYFHIKNLSLYLLYIIYSIILTLFCFIILTGNFKELCVRVLNSTTARMNAGLTSFSLLSPGINYKRQVIWGKMHRLIWAQFCLKSIRKPDPYTVKKFL